MISSQQPFIICVRDLTAGYPTHLHWHDADEIGYVIRGAGLFVHDDEVVPLQAGQVYITNDTRCHTAFSLHFYGSPVSSIFCLRSCKMRISIRCLQRAINLLQLVVSDLPPSCL